MADKAVITKGNVVLELVGKREAQAKTGTKNKTALAVIADKIAELDAKEQVEIDEISSVKVNKEQEHKNILKDFELAKRDVLANEADSIDTAKSEIELSLIEAGRQHKAEANDCDNLVLAEEARHKQELKKIQDRKEMSELKLNTIKAQSELKKKNIDQTIAKIKRATEKSLQDLERQRDQDLMDLDNTEKSIQTRIKKCKNEYSAKRRALESSKIEFLSEDATKKELEAIYDRAEETLIKISQPQN